jgi:hypothetical protein
LKLLVCTLVSLLSLGDPALAQQAAAPQTSAATPAQVSTGAPPAPNTLLDGTAVKLRLAENLTSASAKVGQQVAFEVTEEVDVEGVPVILKGAQAVATVTDAAPKKNMGRGGKLDVNVDSTRLVDGEKVQLRAVRENKGGGHVGAMTGAIVATAIVFFPAAPLFLFMKGKDIVIPEGTPVTAFVEGDMHLDMAKMSSPVATPTAQPGNRTPLAAAAAGASAPDASAPSTPASPAMASLTVDATVPGADIEVDGAFVGNTPSTVSVTPGQHTITVKKKGYADWSKTMNVSGSGVRLNAELEAGRESLPQPHR